MASLYGLNFGEEESIILGYTDEDNEGTETIVRGRGGRGRGNRRGRGGGRRGGSGDREGVDGHGAPRGRGNERGSRERGRGDRGRGGRDRGRGGSDRGRGGSDQIRGGSEQGRGRRDRERGRGDRGRGGSDRGRGASDRGRGGGGGARSSHIHRLQINDLMSIAKCTPEDVVLKLQEDLKGFQHSLNSCNKVSGGSRNAYICTVLRLLLKVCEARRDVSYEASSTILAEFLSERCAEFHILLKMYIQGICIERNYEVTLNIIFELFQSLLNNFPTSAWQPLPIDDLVTAVNDFSSSHNLRTKVADLKVQRDDIRRQQMEKKKPKVDTQNEENWDNSEYRMHLILPTMDEICNSTPPMIRSNIIEGAYTDWEHYYDVQFRLLREDFIAPLRRGVSMFCSAERVGRLTDIHVYNDVELQKPDFTENGVCYTVQFDTSRFRQRKSWEHSKRLIFGSLLCFSPKWDKFKEHIYFATVAERKSEELNRGVFHVQFEKGLDMFRHICKTKFTVIESKAYFEASRHILRSLQSAETDTMPFTRYLINNQPTPVKAPLYLENNSSFYDIRWLYPSKESLRFRQHLDLLERLSLKERLRLRLKESLYLDPRPRCIDITGEWPSDNDIELDESQIEAIKMALTQEISVIQGPPGTGKTYIGYKIVQTLLQNRDIWDPHETSPILVMCYTNHALDQFLQGIISHKVCRNKLDDVPNIVRIGGRSKSEAIQECSLFNARGRYVPIHDLIEVRQRKDEIIEIASRIPWYNLQSVILNPVNEFFIRPEGFEELKPGIHPTYLYQLALTVTEYDGTKNLSLEYWLGLWTKEYLVPSPVTSPGNQVPPIIVESPSNQINSPSIEAINNDEQQHVHQSEAGTLEEETAVEEEKIQVTGEAEMEDSNRRLDYDGYLQLPLKEGKEDTGVIKDDMFSKHIQRQKSHDQSFDQPKQFKSVRKNQTEIEGILRIIRNCEPFDPEDEEEISDINQLSMLDRYRLLRLWITRYKERLGDISHDLLECFEQKCDEYKRAQQDIDRIALERAEVIGMTTTGAAKYQHILHLVKPKIVIVEEAAEVLESHIVSALNAGTQHLILIGDHKQLRPKPNEYELAKKHNLDVSLFERLIRNGLPHATLLIQHRMRPQIASLVRPSIYKTLINHDSVELYDDIKSCDKNMYFFHHTFPETEIEYLLSHSNAGEAELVVCLCRHFLKQGYNPSQITILTAYTGQLLCVRDKMPRKEFEGVQVTNVDNFQGEENDIIILSLVRNNDERKVGFLREENRVCVALSRAKMGFYCFGNFEMLRSVVPIWEVILSHVSSEGCLGSALPLHCHNHPDFKIPIKEANEFAVYFPDGGCKKPCTYRLDCGHQCKRSCHVTDVDHINYECREPCTKLCTRDLHPCGGRCFQKCPQCKVLVTKLLPCSHQQIMQCCEDPVFVKCISPCPKRCANDLHDCPLKCSDKCQKCTVMVRRKMPKCEHEMEMYCFENPLYVKCYYPCLKMCVAGLHDCPKECWQECGDCEVMVKRIIPKCGHEQSMKCYQDPNDFRCYKNCQTIYGPCGHKCPKRCYEECDVLCQQRVDKVLPQCSHINKLPCHMDPKDAKCTQPCERTRHCGHPCKGQCGQSCSSYPCKETKVIALPCSHKISVACSDFNETHSMILHGTYVCQDSCLKKLPCGHPCKSKCNEPCSTTLCREKVPYTCPKGVHTKKLQCRLHADPPQCNEPCGLTLPCGHKCKKKCYEECSEFCDMYVSKRCPCGHKHNFKCGDTTKCLCTQKCTTTLECGHQCSGSCGECFTSRIHSPCTFQVQVNRFCGHSASLPCFGLLDQCDKTCRLAVCPHNRKGGCEHKCFEDCPVQECTQKCTFDCPHDKCSRDCRQVCLKPGCKEPCTKTLKCGHHCAGACGDKCLQYCWSCSQKKFRDNVKGLGKKPTDAQISLRLDCDHVYTLQYLNDRFNPKPGHDRLISPLSCPACSKPFISTHYWQRSVSIKEDIKQIKTMLSSDSGYNDQVYDDLRYSVEDMLIVRGITTKHMFLSKRDSEGLCSLQLIHRANELQSEMKACFLPNSDQLIEAMKSFIKIIVDIIRNSKGKLSLQLISDIESELFRFSLLILRDKVTSTCTSSTDKNVTILLKSLCAQLQLMEEDHKLRLDYQKYNEIFRPLNRMSRSSLTLVKSVGVPKVTKGNWYKCHAGHIYFVQARYKITPSCTVCNS